MIISWNTTNQCNMYCDHCYRDAGLKSAEELSTGQARKLLKEIAQCGFKIMIFSGGEPLMREDIYELIQEARNLGLRPVLGTNGTYITREVAIKLKEAGILGVGISLDSMNPKKHDQLRKMEGAWQSALDGIRNCREAGIPFQIHTTIFDWNQDEVLQITDLAVELGAVAHHFFFLVPTGRAVSIEEESLRAEQYEEILKKIMEKQKTVDIELKPTCAPQFMRIARQMGMNLRFGRGCLAGTSYCIISPTGDVQPCAYLNLPVGNVKDTPFDILWRESDVLKRLRTLDYTGGCGACGYRKLCGGCRARAHFYHGDYMAEEPWCDFHGRKGY
ncbi:MAG: putative heme d1 biosynthesis radical SAM protein NirJ2 [Syntrophomonadaceae bacterium]|nr:putative heme d1 biosynthesis radical SAM protein NirJ2 [Syntrophomonadaceae bacterium]